VTATIAAAHALIIVVVIVLPVSHCIPSLSLRGIAASLRYEQKSIPRGCPAAPFKPAPSAKAMCIGSRIWKPTPRSTRIFCLALRHADRSHAKFCEALDPEIVGGAWRACRLSRYSRRMRLVRHTPDQIPGGH